MKPTLRYFFLTLKHKWFVLLAGRQLKVSAWKLIIHDWSKFFPSELPHYGRQFFGKADDALGFAICWAKHQNRHPHHWEYWVPRTGHSWNDAPYKDNEPLPMPESAAREMVADWMGASRAYEGHWPNPHNWKWLSQNRPKMCLHPNSLHLIDKIVQELRMQT